jgi:hypothetical protein
VRRTTARRSLAGLLVAAAVTLGLPAGAVDAAPVARVTAPPSPPPLAAAQAVPRSVVPVGTAGDFGDMSATVLNGPVNDLVGTASGRGYWLLGDDGGVFSFGDARFFGSMGGQPLNDRVISLAPTPTGNGYWFVARDGGMFSFGDAQFFGSMGGQPLNRPVVGMVPTASGLGYWLVAADGGVFAFGDAAFVGSLGSEPPEEPIVALAATPDGRGYWMADRSGRVYAFGTARNRGWDVTEVAVVDLVGTPDGGGYWVLLADGTVRSYGNATRFSPTVTIGPGQRAVGVDSTPDGTGLWVATTGRFDVKARPGSPAYALTTTNRGVVRWNPCEEIPWYYNPAGAPAGATVEFFAAGMAHLGEVTGFAFRYAGITSESPLSYTTPGIVLGWDALPSFALGIGGGNIRLVGGTVRRTTGGLALNNVLSEPFGWIAGWGPVLLHELGHVMGLEHVDDPEQLMYPSRSYVTGFAAGDRAGLWAIGPAQGCLP